MFSYLGLIVIVWMLSRTVPWTAAPGLPKGADLRADPLTIALRTALVLSVAWLVTSMYTLSWYDLIAWMPLAVLAASKLDRIMLLRIAPLSLAYVPGRAIEYGPALDFTATRIRDTFSPIVQIAVLVAVVLWWKKPDRPELFPFRAPTVAVAHHAARRARRHRRARAASTASGETAIRLRSRTVTPSRRGSGDSARRRERRSISPRSSVLAISATNDAPTAAGRVGHARLVEVEQLGGDLVLAIRSVPNIGGSSELIVTGTPAATSEAAGGHPDSRPPGGRRWRSGRRRA